MDIIIFDNFSYFSQWVLDRNCIGEKNSLKYNIWYFVFSVSKFMAARKSERLLRVEIHILPKPTLIAFVPFWDVNNIFETVP